MHDFPADGEYVFKVGFYYSPTGPLFGLNQGKGQQIEIAVNGERVALLDINPAMNTGQRRNQDAADQDQSGPAADFGVLPSEVRRAASKTNTEWSSRAWWTSARARFRG